MTIWSPRTNVTKIHVLSLSFRAKNLSVLYVFIDKVVKVLHNTSSHDKKSKPMRYCFEERVYIIVQFESSLGRSCDCKKGSKPSFILPKYRKPHFRNASQYLASINKKKALPELSYQRLYTRT